MGEWVNGGQDGDNRYTARVKGRRLVASKQPSERLVIDDQPVPPGCQFEWEGSGRVLAVGVQRELRVDRS